MLHAIDESGVLTWHCPDPRCPYHNCAVRDQGISCPTHVQGVQGQSHTTHISDPGVQWTGPDHVMLPVCEECGTHMGLKVHSDIAEPIITKDEITGKILQVTMPEEYAHHGNLWFKDADIVHHAQPHPTLAHLSVGEIQAMQEHIKAKAPDAPVDWMMTMVPHEEIHAVYPHPAIARHRELARQLQAIGKVYKAPEPAVQEMVSLHHVKDLMQLLGIDNQVAIDRLDALKKASEDTDKHQAIHLDPPSL